MNRPILKSRLVTWICGVLVATAIVSVPTGQVIAQADSIRPERSRAEGKPRYPRVKLRDKSPAAVSLMLSHNVPDPSNDGLNDHASSFDQDPAMKLWWFDKIAESTRPAAQPLLISLDSLLMRAVAYSSQIKVYSDVPLIRETAVIGANAAFDWHAFLDSRWADTNDPVGNTLTGAFPRYKNQQLSNATGLRRRTVIGGRLEASQQFGFQNSNSIYLNPNPQATTRLAISYTQPLMRGSGQVYNKSLVCLAEIETKVADSEFSRKLQSHLLNVTHAFWTVYVERTNVILKQRSLRQAEDVAATLSDREGIDTVQSQIQRAEAEMASRQSDLLRARASVRTAEARLRSMVNDPELGTYETVELIPIDRPTQDMITINPTEALSVAIMFRPEVVRSLSHIKAGAIRMDMAKNELLPLLNVITQTYVAALSNGNDVAESWANQFTTGDPSYSTGLQLEAPLGNRAARARLDRRTLECRQLQNEYETTVKALALEVGMAVREVRATYYQMNAQSKAVRASSAQLEIIEQRWKLLPGEGDNGSLVLENTLQAQSRSTKSSSSFVKAWVDYNLALVDLKRATGELLQQEQVTWSDYREECNGIKARVVEKASPETLVQMPQPAKADSNGPSMKNGPRTLHQ